MMVICVQPISAQDPTPCGREMVCAQVGVDVICTDRWVYSGDRYKCPRCGSQTVITASKGYDPGESYDPHKAIEERGAFFKQGD